MKQETQKKIINLIDKTILKNQYDKLTVYKKVLIAQMVDKIEKIIMEAE